LVLYQYPYWVALQKVVFADGRVRLRRVRCLGEDEGARVGEAWIGSRLAIVTEVKSGVWREEKKPKETSAASAE
jgi:hypothetical protein